MDEKDRSAGLVVFGVLTIGLGCLAALLILLILWAQTLPTPTKMPMSSVLPGIAVYGGLAVALTWLGIGSILARRWARALLLIFSWSWLVTGVLALTMMACMLPSMLARTTTTTPQVAGQPASQAILAMVLLTTFLVEGVIFLVLPAIWTFFYSSRHVKATCERRHHLPCWTDACPLPVLALVLWLVYGVAAMSLMPLLGFAIVPFFGTFLTGMPAALCLLLFAAVWLYSAWLSYRLDLRGWWLVILAFSLIMVSTFITYTRRDPLEMYRLMHFPPDQLALLQHTGLFSGHRILWMTALFMVPFLGYLLFVRRYFSRAV